MRWPEGTFLARLPATERAALISAGSERAYRGGTPILHQGDPSRYLFMLLEGGVKVSSFTANGNELVLAIRGTGDIVGELAAIDNRPRSATVSTLADVRALLLHWNDFTSVERLHPHVTDALLQVVAERVRESSNKRIDFRYLDVRARVARDLLDLSQRFGVVRRDGTVALTLPLSQREVGGLAGASREAAAKAFRSLRQRRAISTGRRSIVIVDRAELRKVARL